MKHSLNLPTLLLVVAATLLMASCDVRSSIQDHFRRDSEKVMASDSTPSIKGVVLIESPRTGSLLQLRGIAGKGTLVALNHTIELADAEQGDALCRSKVIKLAAGDFGGTTVGIQSADAIQLVIYSDTIVNKLMSGDEIVSENYNITDQNDAQLGDIKIQSGLTLSYGFVLNPSEWSWSSLFGGGNKSVACDWLEPESLLAAL